MLLDIAIWYFYIVFEFITIMLNTLVVVQIGVLFTALILLDIYLQQLMNHIFKENRLLAHCKKRWIKGVEVISDTASVELFHL